ncbi:hypothetical protein BTO05_10160 [Winogradskyella sp. PC-19]|uniref:hypothetical protein n=1 Tax=unclassified Winogradskyella TaxID=2615021 RepID=UPI000B3CD38F|nr:MULTISPECIES: hypothetical protein [unclassified Winogradskyella]ARV09982.1 hypothetical protein BTO05_10160 [Winogradskyella sp. PC-19]RZN79945.1 MAG: hypothetical protein EVB12_04425 [Winogradskyella sp.]
MKKGLIIILFFCFTKSDAQVNEDILYLKYDENISINEYYDNFKILHIDLRFTINNQGEDARPTTYKYRINNISLDGDLKFNEIKNIVSDEDLKNIKLTTIDDLRKLNSCDLFFLLADSKIFLIKDKENIHYKYALSYKSTARGIEYFDNGLRF